MRNMKTCMTRSRRPEPGIPGFFFFPVAGIVRLIHHTIISFIDVRSAMPMFMARKKCPHAESV